MAEPRQCHSGAKRLSASGLVRGWELPDYVGGATGVTPVVCAGTAPPGHHLCVCFVRGRAAGRLFG